jgi:hypothetical protein
MKKTCERKTEQSLPCKNEESFAQFSERFWEVRRKK